MPLMEKVRSNGTCFVATCPKVPTHWLEITHKKPEDRRDDRRIAYCQHHADANVRDREFQDWATFRSVPMGETRDAEGEHWDG